MADELIPTKPDIPVINAVESPREELLRYIRILEARLEIDHVYEVEPDGGADEPSSDGSQAGDDDTGDGSGPRTFLDRMRRIDLDQAERVSMLRRGSDGIGARDIGRAYHEPAIRAPLHRRVADASEDERQALRAHGYAVAARYDAVTERLVVALHTGMELALPVRLLEGLADAADPGALAEITLTSSGLGLRWPRLGVEHYVPLLVDGVFGSKSWTASIRGGETPVNANWLD